MEENLLKKKFQATLPSDFSKYIVNILIFNSVCHNNNNNNYYYYK